MKKILMDRNWQFLESNLVNKLYLAELRGWKSVDLPHDIGVEKERCADLVHGVEEGFTQAAGLYYKKRFMARNSAQGKSFWLEFEGVTGITQVWLNGEFMAKHLNSYTGFLIEVTDYIRQGEINELLVFTDNRQKPDSRWYTGTGIYSHVWMHIGEEIYIRPQSVHVTTQNLDGQKAEVLIEAGLNNRSGKEYEIQILYSIIDDEGNEVAHKCEGHQLSKEGEMVSTQFSLEGIVPWCVEMPYLYKVRVEVATDDGQTDETICRMGIRTVEADSNYGLLLNSKQVKLKGGCIHHDLGILGTASHDAAIYRKIKLLKDNGYNALRFAHNPYVPAYFDACDELGILVVEEAFDEWVLGKASFGHYSVFEYEWKKDLEAMIGREYNHPSIIMWSIGNDVEEREGWADGYVWSHRLATKVKTLDVSRPVSVTACSLMLEYTSRLSGEEGETKGKQELNMAYDNFESGIDLWGGVTEAFFSPVDVAGYSYKTFRYDYDGKKFPNRVIYGSQTYPRTMFDNWQAVLNNKHVIGDFVWTAMDYIGEAGLGRYAEGSDLIPPTPTWPWLTANCGDLDLLGHKRPQSYYRDVIWERDNKPHLFVLPPQLTGKPLSRMSWTWDPVEPNYTYPGFEGKKIEVHIYAAADEVELFQNERSLGRKPTGMAQEGKAIYDICYESGMLKAVAYKEGKETGSDILRTNSKAVKISLLADRDRIEADGMDLCFISIQAEGENGDVIYSENSNLKITVEGDGELIALGTANPRPDRTRPFKEFVCPLYKGVAEAVIRSRNGGSGCTLNAVMGNISAAIHIDYSPPEQQLGDLR